MNFRTTYVLFGAVAVGLIVFIVIMSVGSHGTAEDYALRSLHEAAGTDEQVKKIRDEIDTLEIERNSPKGETLIFKRVTDKDWQLQSPYEAKVDSSQVKQIVDGLVGARIDKTADMTANLAQLGLESPSVVVTLQKGEGKERKRYVLKLGNMTIGSSASDVFAVSPDAPKEPMAIARDMLDGLFRQGSANSATAGEALKSITDFRPHNLLVDGSPVPWDIVDRARLIEGGKELALQKDELGGWRFVKPEGYGPVDMEGDPAGPSGENIAGLRPMLTALAGLRIPMDSLDVIEGAPNFAEYGLDPGQVSWRVELDRKAGGMEVLYVGKKTEDKGEEKIDPKAPNPKSSEKVYVRLNNERLVVKLPAKALEPIHKLIDRPANLRDRNLVNLSLPAVDAIDIKLPGEKKLELRRIAAPAMPNMPGMPPMPPQWRIFEEGSEVSEQANFKAVSDLLTALAQRRQIREFPEGGDDKSYALDTPAAEIAIWQDGIMPEKKEEKKEPEAKDDKKGEKKETEKKEEPKESPPKRPTLKGEAAVRLKFGKKDKDIVYLRRQLGTFSAIVAVPEGLLAAVSKKYLDFLDMILPSFDPFKAIKLAFNRGQVKYEFEKGRGDIIVDSWKIVQPADQAGRTADYFKVHQQILTNLSSLQAKRIFTRKATDADLARWGLQPPRIEAAVTLQYTKEPFVVQLGTETEDNASVYLKFAGKDVVYLVDKRVADFILQGEVQDTTIFRFVPEKVQVMKITGWKDAVRGATTLELVRKSETDWSVKGNPDYKVDPQKAEDFARSLALVRTEGFVSQKGEPKSEYGLDVNARAQVIEITVEGEKDPFTLTVGALEKDGKTCYATSNKAPGAIFLVFKERFEEVRKSPEYFLKK